MDKIELIKGILKLGEELDKDHGMGSVMIIDDMQRLIDKYVEQLNIADVVGRSEQLCVECKSATTPMPDMMCEPCYKAKTNR